MSNILFIAWDGPQTSYLEGLFLPIFEGLAREGYYVHVLQFTWADEERIAKSMKTCEERLIPYRAVKVTRVAGPLGPFVTAIAGARHIAKAAREWKIDTLMPRSLMPALAVLALPERRRYRLIFDADGFAVDERADFAGMSRNGPTYRILRAVESRAARLADRVLVRTPRAADLLAHRAKADRAKFHVVGNGRDPAPFLRGWPERTDTQFCLCYAGSLGVQYRTDQMIAIALRLRAELPNLVFRVFTGDGDALKAALDRRGVENRDWIEVSRLPPSDMPVALMQCDLALALRQRAFSTQGVSPIKLGEYMLAGLPTVGTKGVGHIEPLVEGGVMLPVEDDIEAVWPWVRDVVIPDRLTLRAKAQALGLEHFSLDASVQSYLRALNPELFKHFGKD